MYRLIEIIAEGVLPNKEVGGLGPRIKFGGKIWARSGQVHQIRGEIWQVLSPQDAKVGKKSQQNSDGKIWGICHLYFWRQNLRLQQEFQRQNLGPSPPDILIWKYPPGDNREKNTNVCIASAEPEFSLNHEGFKESHGSIHIYQGSSFCPYLVSILAFTFIYKRNLTKSL